MLLFTNNSVCEQKHSAQFCFHSLSPPPLLWGNLIWCATTWFATRIVEQNKFMDESTWFHVLYHLLVQGWNSKMKKSDGTVGPCVGLAIQGPGSQPRLYTWLSEPFSSLLPHLFSGDVGLEDRQDPFQLENAIILTSSRFDKETHNSLGFININWGKQVTFL